MTTLFEKIINRELDSTIHYEDEEVICIEDKFPQAPVHLLIITKKRIPSIHEMQREDRHLLAKIFTVIQEMAKKFGVESSYRVVTNHGIDAGQTVFHLHFHLLGGKTLGAKGG